MNRGHFVPSSILGSLRVLEKGYLLEQGSTSILEHLGGSSRASMVVPLLEHAEHRSMLCSNMLVHNTTQDNHLGGSRNKYRGSAGTV